MYGKGGVYVVKIGEIKVSVQELGALLWAKFARIRGWGVGQPNFGNVRILGTFGPPSPP